jgi:(1->4)-alpha-D-glucan 1-alpha-D-glucosylmutase
MHTLRATYRVQFEPAFRFAEAVSLVSALAALGISHVYASPVFESVAGSRHGYDVIDPGRVREALGGESGWRGLAGALADAGLGLIADIVPNHLAISGSRWWADVLEHGRASRYFPFFDLTVSGDDDAPSLVIPLLAEPYGEELESGQLSLVEEDGLIRVAYGAERFPLSPESMAALLEGHAGSASNAVRRLNADHEALHALLEAQHYRLAWWRLARDESPYRRFFDVNALVAMRVERDEVFEAVHRLPLAWLRDGVVDGLRVDHVDGLADPTAYLRRLRAEAPHAWIGVEKILAPDEPWPGWTADGTTGYEFGALVTRLLTAAEAEAPLTAYYETITGLTDRFEDVARDAKHEMLAHWLLGDAERVALVLHDRCQQTIHLRDYSQRDCLTVVQELVAQTPVYRTYVGRGTASPRDAAILAGMFEGLRQSRPDLPAPLIAYVEARCLEPGDDAAFVIRLQQLSTAVAAKAVEDTAFYRYARFVAHNEVGADPPRFSEDVDAFHQTVARWQAEQPFGLRASSTHDSKRSEDVRARLTVLSENVDAWMQQASAWRARTDALRIDHQPDAGFEYYLYQTLVGAWPLSRERAHAHAEKAVREAKLFTNWTTPSPEYERAVHRLVDGLYDDEGFIGEVEAFVASLHPADWHKALAQLLLKITIPGVPDFYQGAHGWLLTLADPDNRTLVEYEPLCRGLSACAIATPEEVAARMDEGLPKLWITMRALGLRHRHDDLAPKAAYRPLPVSADGTDAHALAFQRGQSVAVVVPTRTFDRSWAGVRVSLPAGSWRDVLTDRTLDGGDQPVEDLWRTFPVALLERADA